MSKYRDAYEPDICDLEGAKSLAEKIKAYWRDRGFIIQAEAQFQGFNKSMRSGYYAIRSDLRNALPRPDARL